jgi:protein-disulfide isomerase
MNRKPWFLIVALTLLIIWPEARTYAQTPGTNNAKSPAASGKASTATSSSPDAIENTVVQYLRNMYAWGPEFDLTVGAIKQSSIPDLLEMPVTVGAHGQSDTATVYVSKDGKFMVRGEVTDMSVDPLADTRSKLHVGTSPSMCPSCRQLDRILRDFLPKHPEVRLVYKDFPLNEIHPWAMTAAIAAQCVNQQDPALFWKIHDMIFDAQDSINSTNVTNQIKDFANRLNVNDDSFEKCRNNPSTGHAVQMTKAEGQEVGVTGTPTIFVNGRRIVGPDESTLTRFIEYEIRPK